MMRWSYLLWIALICLACSCSCVQAHQKHRGHKTKAHAHSNGTAAPEIDASDAAEAFADFVVAYQSALCTAVNTPTADSLLGYITPVSKLIVDIKRQQARTQFYRCDQSWNGIAGFAEKALRAYAAKWDAAAAESGCRCRNVTEVFESSDENLDIWTEQWVGVFETVDDIACFRNIGYVPEPQLEQCVGQVIVEGWSKFASDTWLSGDCDIEPPPECDSCCDRFTTSQEPSTAFNNTCSEQDCSNECFSRYRDFQAYIALDVLEDDQGPDRRTCLQQGVDVVVKRLVDRFSPSFDETFMFRVEAEPDNDYSVELDTLDPRGTRPRRQPCCKGCRRCRGRVRTCKGKGRRFCCCWRR